MSAPLAARRALAPEVVQTSAMDCGPAALTCLLEGFGIRASYGRLREACQTDVDGTSIDTLELVANQLGLDAEQVMLPVDHLPLDEAGALPAMLVVRHPNGLTHFVVAWRRHGRWVQVMDPAVGRRWTRWSRLREEVFVHSMPVPAAGWREWAGTDDFLAPLRRRLRDLGVGDRWAGELLGEALSAPGWRPLARLDAAARMTAALADAGGVARGRAAAGLLRELHASATAEEERIPAAYWTVRPAPADGEGEEHLWFRGAVLLRVRGRRPSDVEAAAALARHPELAAALAEPRPRPLRELSRLMGGDGPLPAAIVGASLLAAAASVVLEVLVLRGAMEMGTRLGLVEQRLQAAGYFLAFLLVLLALELGVAHALARLGRRLELRLRTAFLEKIPRLQERYFQSRPVSDMAERSHTVHQLRQLPRWGGQLARSVAQLALTAVALAWLYPALGWAAAAAALLSLLLPLVLLPVLLEQDVRVRTHVGALARFQLDALLGLAPVRSHSAEPAVQREQEGLLVEWVRAGRARLRSLLVLEGVQALVGFGLAGWIFWRYVAAGGGAGGTLLLAYWALSIPVLGGEVAALARQLPTFRTTALRLLEPLGAPEAEEAPADAAPAAEPARGVEVALEEVTVCAAGHLVLEEVSLRVAPGEHVAVIGPSGAGKSSLVGLLLGWHRAERGHVRVDGVPLGPGQLARLRQQTAWLDPGIHLWNRSLLDNVTYGVAAVPGGGLGGVLDGANLGPVLNRLPEGLQSPVGEGGGLLSGGEGQRVRLARAMLRWDARLVILDEPFRGLDGEARRRLLRRARRLWKGSTLFCVTHDVSEALHFDRVVVVDGGRVVADGCPDRLAADPESRFAQLLAAERLGHEETWGHPAWRRARLCDGRVSLSAETAP